MTRTGPEPLEILHTLGIDETAIVMAVQGGFDMLMWKVEYEGQSYALRVFRSGRHEDCEHERMVMSAARDAGLPVPEVCRVSIWQDHPVLLLTWQPGRTVADELRARPWRLWQVGIAFGRMQAAIHAVPAPDPLRQQPDAWIAWKCEGEQLLHDRLRCLMAQDSALLHLDYHPHNVLTDGKQITGVVDWTHAHAGDPRADIARTVSILRIDPLARKPFIQWLALRVFERAWRAGYQRERGPLENMPLFYAWAGNVLLQSLADRYKHTPQKLTPARRWTSKWMVRVQ